MSDRLVFKSCFCLFMCCATLDKLLNLPELHLFPLKGETVSSDLSYKVVGMVSGDAHRESIWHSVY